MLQPTAPFRLSAAVCLCLLLAGCFATEGSTGGASLRRGRPGVERDPTLLVATTREPVSDGVRKPWFSGQRGNGLVFTKAHLDRPDRSLTGRVTSVVTGDWNIASVDPVDRDDAAQAFAQASLGEDVLLYIHGYRESFELAAVNAASFPRDPASGRHRPFHLAFGGLDLLLRERPRERHVVARRDGGPPVRRREIADGRPHPHRRAQHGHAFDARDPSHAARSTAARAPMSRIGAVVLAAPDIDFDLFARGVERLGPDASKITVISATNDRALAVSSRIAGGFAARRRGRPRAARSARRPRRRRLRVRRRVDQPRPLSVESRKSNRW